MLLSTGQLQTAAGHLVSPSQGGETIMQHVIFIVCVPDRFEYHVLTIFFYSVVHYVLGYNQLSIAGLGVSASSLRATTSPANAPDVPYDSEFLSCSNLLWWICY